MITLTPAYGRDYKSKKAAEDDFRADKDFILNDIFSSWDGKPINRSQLIKDHKMVKLRYNKLRKSAIVAV